ncbi:MAG: TOBE domain-containing protein [Candidatus Adiutrix sp.]|jgi:molybdate transport system regulatory protein|nr:TOBE domain-containing protein [Candidatus Adiutrix sp.]
MKIGEHKKRRSKIDRLELLTLVHELGSISAAAKKLGVSYKAAWEAVEQFNNLSEHPLLDRKTGGEAGGGSSLTAHGLNVLNFMKKMEFEFDLFLKALGQTPKNFEALAQYMKIISFTTSARNQFGGRVVEIKTGAVISEVQVDIGGDRLVATISNKSVQNMGLERDHQVYALINANGVLLTTDRGFKSSARNRFTGLVKYCEIGSVNGEVILDLPGGKSIVSSLTNESILDLGLKVGLEVTALIKASHVILATV